MVLPGQLAFDCAVWRSLWCHRHACFLCNNHAVDYIYLSTFQIPCIMDLLRFFTIFTLLHHFNLARVHLADLQNGVTGFRSCFQIEGFRELLPDALSTGLTPSWNMESNEQSLHLNSTFHFKIKSIDGVLKTTIWKYHLVWEQGCYLLLHPMRVPGN